MTAVYEPNMLLKVVIAFTLKFNYNFYSELHFWSIIIGFLIDYFCCLYYRIWSIFI